MRRVLLGAVALWALTGTAEAGWLGRWEVFGVGEDDMLKMRAGPGVGFAVIVGLPDGSVVRVYDCQRTGATKWCEVALDVAPGLRGYVSEAYIRKR